MDLLVSDTSVLVDLERGNLLTEAFRLPYGFVVPDLLYERELQDRGGGDLLALGLKVADLTADEVEAARACRRKTPALSLPDAFALALAESQGLTLLTGDRRLRATAADGGVSCHGLLWLFDQMLTHGIAPSQLHAGLTTIWSHPRCRLPKAAVTRRMEAYAVRPSGSDGDVSRQVTRTTRR